MRRPSLPSPRSQPSLIAEIPHDERPRERLLRNGPQALSDAELIAILLKGGRKGASVLDLSRELLFQAGGLRGLANSCTKSLRRNGVGEVKIATLLAAVEIACRMAAAAVPVQEPLSRAAEVGRYIDLRYGRSGQEVMGALYVCARHRLIGERELYRGTLLWPGGGPAGARGRRGRRPQPAPGRPVGGGQDDPRAVHSGAPAAK